MDIELPPLAPVPGQSLVEAIYVTLRDAIIRGQLRAGERLREIPLASHFDVSTTPVRSALQRLDFEGLVEISPRRGAVVASADSAELEDLYELRELLETHALRSAVESNNQDFAELEEVLSRCSQAIVDGDQAGFNELDLDFHGRLTELGGNQELLEVATQTHRRIQTVRTRYAVTLPEQPPVSQQEHEAIVAALRAQDVVSAVELLRRHINSVRGAVLDAVRSGVEPETEPVAR